MPVSVSPREPVLTIAWTNGEPKFMIVSEAREVEAGAHGLDIG